MPGAQRTGKETAAVSEAGDLERSESYVSLTSEMLRCPHPGHQACTDVCWEVRRAVSAATGESMDAHRTRVADVSILPGLVARVPAGAVDVTGSFHHLSGKTEWKS